MYVLRREAWHTHTQTHTHIHAHIHAHTRTQDATVNTTVCFALRSHVRMYARSSSCWPSRRFFSLAPNRQCTHIVTSRPHGTPTDDDWLSSLASRSSFLSSSCHGGPSPIARRPLPFASVPQPPSRRIVRPSDRQTVSPCLSDRPTSSRLRRTACSAAALTELVLTDDDDDDARGG